MLKLEDLTRNELMSLAEKNMTCIGNQIFLIRFNKQVQEKLDQNIFHISFKATKESMYYAPKSQDQLEDWKDAWLIWSPGRFSLQMEKK